VSHPSRTIELPPDWEKQLTAGFETAREFAETVPDRVEAAWAAVSPHVTQAVTAMEPHVKTARAAVAPYLDRGVQAVSPYVEEARGRIAPVVDRVTPVVGPALAEAKDRVGPSVDYARHHLVNTVAPATRHWQPCAARSSRAGRAGGRSRSASSPPVPPQVRPPAR